MKKIAVVFAMLLVPIAVFGQGQTSDPALEAAKALLQEANGRVIQLSAQGDTAAKRIKALEDEIAKLKSPAEPKKDP